MERSVEILYEDEDVIVCRKPAGLATETARVGQADVASELKKGLAARRRKTGKTREGEPYLGMVHRLDQPVEGLLVFGKSREVTAKLSAQLGGGSFHKRYRAVVCGELPQKEGELVDFLYKNRENRAVVTTEQEALSRGARRAVLRYRVLGVRSLPAGSCEESISLLEISIDTGRFHQIRAQMAHAGHPLLGDRKYGEERSLLLSGELGVKNVALCACEIAFSHPVTGRTLQFTAEPRDEIFGSF